MLSKKTFFIVAIIITLSLLGTLLTVHIMQKNSKNSPEFALKKIAVAIEKRQLKTFTQYVDTQSLSESILKEFMEDPQKGSAAEGSFWGEIKNIGKTIQNRISDYIKPELVNSIETQMTTYITTGYFSAKKDITNLYSNKPILEKVWLDLSGESFKFLGFEVVQKTNQKATANLLFKRQDLDFSSSLKVLLHKKESGWQVTALENLGETLNQIETLRVKKIQSKNKELMQKMQDTLHIVSIEKSDGLSKGQFGEMRVMLRIAFQNQSKEDIQKFKADITFKKKDGTLLRKVKIEDTDVIPAGDIVEKSWPLTLSPLSKDDHVIFKSPRADLLIDVTVKELAFTTGEVIKLIPTESK